MYTQLQIKGDYFKNKKDPIFSSDLAEGTMFTLVGYDDIFMISENGVIYLEYGKAVDYDMVNNTPVKQVFTKVELIIKEYEDCI